MQVKVIFEVKSEDLAAVLDMIYNVYKTPNIRVLTTTIIKEGY